MALGFKRSNCRGRLPPTSSALRIKGLSQWIMWEFARLFENLGYGTRRYDYASKPHNVVDKIDVKPLNV